MAEPKNAFNELAARTHRENVERWDLRQQVRNGTFAEGISASLKDSEVLVIGKIASPHKKHRFTAEFTSDAAIDALVKQNVKTVYLQTMPRHLQKYADDLVAGKITGERFVQEASKDPSMQKFDKGGKNTGADLAQEAAQIILKYANKGIKVNFIDPGEDAARLSLLGSPPDLNNPNITPDQKEKIKEYYRDKKFEAGWIAGQVTGSNAPGKSVVVCESAYDSNEVNSSFKDKPSKRLDFYSDQRIYREHLGEFTDSFFGYDQPDLAMVGDKLCTTVATQNPTAENFKDRLEPYKETSDAQPAAAPAPGLKR